MTSILAHNGQGLLPSRWINVDLQNVRILAGGKQGVRVIVDQQRVAVAFDIHLANVGAILQVVEVNTPVLTRGDDVVFGGGYGQDRQGGCAANDLLLLLHRSLLCSNGVDFGLARGLHHVDGLLRVDVPTPDGAVGRRRQEFCVGKHVHGGDGVFVALEPAEDGYRGVAIRRNVVGLLEVPEDAGVVPGRTEQSLLGKNSQGDDPSLVALEGGLWQARLDAIGADGQVARPRVQRPVVHENGRDNVLVTGIDGQLLLCLCIERKGAMKGVAVGEGCEEVGERRWAPCGCPQGVGSLVGKARRAPT